MKKQLLTLAMALLISPQTWAQSGHWQHTGLPNFSDSVSNYLGDLNEGSITTDQSGNVYVAFADRQLGNRITAMKYDGTAWANVGSPGFSGGIVSYNYCSSIAIGPTGTPYIAFASGNNPYAVTPMKFNGSTWDTIGAALPLCDAIDNVHIAVDAHDTAYICYYCSGTIVLKKFNGTSWMNVGYPSPAGGLGLYPFLTLSSTGVPYIAYCFKPTATSNFFTVVERYISGAWSNVGSFGFSNEEYYPSIAMGKNDTPYCAYEDLSGTSSARIRATKFNGSSWISLDSPFVATVSTTPLIKIDTLHNIPYLAWWRYEEGTPGPHVLKFNGSAWDWAGIAQYPTTIPGGVPSYMIFAREGLTVSSTGKPYVLCQDNITVNASLNVMELVDTSSSTTKANNLVTADENTRLYPNPANDLLTIETGKNYYRSFIITNDLGQKLKEEHLNAATTTVNIASLPTGIYFIKLIGDNGIKTEKFIKTQP